LTKSSVISPLGLTTKSVSAAFSANISAYKSSSYFSRHRQPMVFASVPHGAVCPLIDILQKTEKLSARQKRMLQLASQALLNFDAADVLWKDVPLFIAGPEQLPHLPAGINNAFLQSLALQTGIEFDRKNSRVFATGRAAGFHAIDHAFKFLAASNLPFVIVGGVDSYRDSVLLGKLDQEDRILCRGISNGFAPGEGAAFILLSKENSNAMKVFYPGFANESGHLYSDEPYRGDGLAQAFKNALSCDMKDISKIYSSMNGEHYFAKELGVAVTRNSAAFLPGVKVEHPADCFGDLGAAYGPIALALVSQQKTGNYIIYGSSDGPYRAAMCAQIVK